MEQEQPTFFSNKIHKSAEYWANKNGYSNDSKYSFIAGYNKAMENVLAVLKENYKACKNLTDEDKARSAQETVNETYEDLILIFTI